MVQIGYDREILHMSDFRRTVSGFGRRKQTMTNSRHLPKTTYSQIKFSSYLICLNLYDPSFGVPRRAITPRPLQRGYEVTELACSLSLAGKDPPPGCRWRLNSEKALEQDLNAGKDLIYFKEE